MNFFLFAVLLIGLLVPGPCRAQQTFRVMSYNVENFFDTKDNPEKEDDDFTPQGIRAWTPGRYHRKLQQTSQTIFAAGEWNPPALIGLCEVENDSVMFHLLHRTPLRHLLYRYCLTHGDDVRGINVALLYRRDLFRLLEEEAIRVPMGEHQRPTRPILRVSGQLSTGDTLDVFICHFPSRYGGEKETEGARLRAARLLKHRADSIQRQRKRPQVLIMGDFNDTPTDRSLTEGLQARPLPGDFPAGISDPHAYYNLFHHARGSHKYQGDWSQIDHILVNGQLLDPRNPFRILPESAHVFAPPFLLKDDRTWRGKRPFRTYHGYRYEGGFSDHLPLLVDFHLANP